MYVGKCKKEIVARKENNPLAIFVNGLFCLVVCLPIVILVAWIFS